MIMEIIKYLLWTIYTLKLISCWYPIPNKYRITTILKVETDIIANISASHIGRAGIFVIMTAKDFRTEVKLDIFPLMCAADKVWITELTLIHKNISSVSNFHVQVYRSIWRKTHNDVTDKNKNFSSEGLGSHYHKYPSSSYMTRWDISDNVCLDLQNCCYPIFIRNWVSTRY
jgi:hypothetical protein